jgi:hypothetical protein
MKTVLKLTTVIAFLLTTVVSTAREPKVNLIASSEAKSLVLTMNNTSSKFGIKFMDEEAHVIYSGKLSDGSFSRKFDLNSLKDGLYFVSVEDEFNTYVYTVSLKGKEVKIVHREEAYKPFFRKTNDKVYINFLNLDKSDVSVKVYDADYRVVYTETYTDTLIVEKAFNFAGAYKGSYSVVISDNDNTYTENFVVN